MAKTNKKYFWFGVLAMLFGSLNIPLMKYATYSINPITLNALRYSLATIIVLPYAIRYSSKITTTNLKYSIFSGISIFVSSICLTMALNLSTATYVTLLTILNPIMLVVFSIKMTKDKINLRKMAGFSLAGIGALLVITAPLIKTNNASLEFYPLATLYSLMIAIAFPLSVIYARKATESRKKLPLTAIIFIQTAVVAVLSIGAGLLTNKLELSSNNVFNPNVYIPIIYSGIFVCVASRVLNVISYKKTGSAINGSLYYLGTFITLLISILILKESLSLVALAGGVIILFGVALAEYGMTLKRKFNTRLNWHH